MPQSILSDYFSNASSSQKQDGGVIELSDSEEEERATPFQSTSKLKIGDKRPVSPADDSSRKKQKATAAASPSRVDRFLYSKPSQEPSSSLPPAVPDDFTTFAAPENEELHQAFVSRFKGPQGKKKRKEPEPAPRDPAKELADKLSEKYALKSKGKGKAKEKEAPKRTPLEEQIIALKAEHPGVMLLFQVGYKFKFYGEDAVNAARVLNVACFWDRSFQSAMIPEHRIDVHIRRLLSAGYKVGVVKQMETAALKKAGDNRAGPFVRKMTQLYTSATRVEELDLTDSPTSSTTVVCIVEQLIGGAGVDERVKLALVSVQPSTAEVIYDEFEDGFMRSELETRLLHLEPGEIALPGEISKQTRRMVKYILGRESDGSAGRLEELVKKHPLAYGAALSHVNDFLSQSAEPLSVSKEGEIDLDGNVNADIEERLQLVERLPKLTVIALAAAIDYLEQYGLDPVFKRGSIHHFQDRVSMKLNANTLQNLEIFANQTDFTERGSLFWILDHTKSRMGRRLLRKWLARPLTDVDAINVRLDTVDEIFNSRSYLVGKLRGMLIGLPDLERGLCRIHYKKASSQELHRVLEAFVRVGDQFEASDNSRPFQSAVLNDTLAALRPAKEAAQAKLAMINATSAREGTLAELFSDPEAYPAISDCRDTLDAVIWEFSEELENAKKVLKKANLEYITVAQEEYLVEVRLAEAKKLVPADWVRINSTKSVYRYRSPRMMSLLQERDQCQERLDAEAKAAFLDFLGRVSEDSAAYREVISRISVLDCLFSFADVASKPGYSRPRFAANSSIWARGLRHPMIEELRDDPFVPNDVHFAEVNGMRTCCLSGANMGGKSTLARSVCIAVVMAQCGCYIAAESFTAGLVDALFTRMGSTDDLQRGRSTFMVELGETSTIIKTATSRSLIVFDELGRGTSTHDGLAIAAATLEHVVRRINPLCIFISHWPFLGRGLADQCKRYHMSFYEENRLSGIPDVVFLRKLAPGPASSSHGLNVARMAALPDSVLAKARLKAEELKEATETRTVVRRATRMVEAFSTGSAGRAVELAGMISEGGTVA